MPFLTRFWGRVSLAGSPVAFVFFLPTLYPKNSNSDRKKKQLGYLGTKIDCRKTGNGYPYSNLFTGGPSQRQEDHSPKVERGEGGKSGPGR